MARGANPVFFIVVADCASRLGRFDRGYGRMAKRGVMFSTYTIHFVRKFIASRVNAAT